MKWPLVQSQTDEPAGIGRLVVAIPTTGRSEIVAKTLRDFSRQTRLPDLLILSVSNAQDADLAVVSQLPMPVKVVSGKKGATNQRNRAVCELEKDDILVFLDDDFLMAADYLERVEQIFAGHPEIVMTTGTVLADGINGPGYDHKQGLKLLTDLDCGVRVRKFSPTYNGYGCNMAVRAQPILNNNLRFDEALPLYSWLEDLDFSRRLVRFGKIVTAHELIGVHLGTKTGRTSGVRTGYSQISNPIFLARKGTMAHWRAQRIMWRNILANLAKSLHPEPWIDRRGRLLGNLMAARDLLTGQLRPNRILDLK